MSTVGFEVDLAGQLGRIGSTLSEMHRAQRQRDRVEVPRDRTLAAAGLYPSTGIMALVLGRPDAGTRWVLRRWGTSYPDPSTGSQQGKAFLVVSGSPPVDPITGGLGGNTIFGTAFRSGAAIEVRDQQASLPAFGGYSSRQVVISSTETLYAVVTGGSASQLYVTSAGVEEYFENAASQEWAL